MLTRPLSQWCIDLDRDLRPLLALSAEERGTALNRGGKQGPTLGSRVLVGRSRLSLLPTLMIWARASQGCINGGRSRAGVSVVVAGRTLGVTSDRTTSPPGGTEAKVMVARSLERPP